MEGGGFFLLFFFFIKHTLRVLIGIALVMQIQCPTKYVLGLSKRIEVKGSMSKSS